MSETILDTWKNRASWDERFSYIKSLNPNISERRKDRHRTETSRSHKLQKVLVANRGEIAKRFFFALHEEGIPSVAIVTDADIGQSWYDFAEEVVHIGDSTHYTNIQIVIAAAVMTGANAIYPGYGFLSEKADFVRAIDIASELFGKKIIFMGPNAEVMDRVGDKVRARLMAKANNVQLLDGEDEISSVEQSVKAAKRIGYPVMVKLSAGGGGRGIVPCFNEEELVAAIESVQRLGTSLYNDDTYFLEKFVQKPIHMEVQIFNGCAVGIRKCAVQRRNQKIIEESGHLLVDDSTALAMLSQAQTISKISGYADGCGAGTVEYLFDADSNTFGFLEMNTRLQVEYAVTEQSLGIDLVRWQIMQFDGRDNEINYDHALKNRVLTRNHAIECRVYAEEPASDYQPSPGLITEIILPTFNGVRCDFGFSANDRVASMYDAMIGKIIAYGSSREETIIRLERALQEVYIRGPHTNIKQLLAIVRHPEFISGKYTNKMIDDFPELNVREVKGGTEHKEERRGRYAIVLGTLAEYVRLAKEKGDDFIRDCSFEMSIENRDAMALAYRFTVIHEDVKYKVEIYPVSLEKYYVMVDGEYNGKVYLSSANPSRGDFIFRYGSRSYRLRLDRRARHITVRLKDGSDKVNYHRLKVTPEGVKGSVDPVGMVRSPFQCSFVSLAKDPADAAKTVRVGSQVKKGDALVIISSMKMETKIVAPVDGKVEYLLEDGDMSRLTLGKTSDGRVLGKSIQEAEVLFMIKPVKAESAQSGDVAEKVFTKHYPTKWFIHESDIEKYLIASPQTFMPLALELFSAGLRGFVQRPTLLPELLAILEKVEEDKWKEVLTPKTEEQLCGLVEYYYNVLTLFSPVIRGGFSFFEELNYYIQNLDNYEYKPGFLFKNLLSSILGSYGISELKPSVEGETNMNAVAFMNLQHSYYICYENKEVIKKLIRILSYSPNKLPGTVTALSKLVLHEQSEPDDSLAVFARKVLAEKFPANAETVAGAVVKCDVTVEEFLSKELCCGKDAAKKMLHSLENPEKDVVPSKVSKALAEDLKKKIELLGTRFSVERIYSPCDDVLVYSLTADGVKSYLVYAAVANFTAPESGKGTKPEIQHYLVEDGLLRAFRLLCAYQMLQPRQQNRVELLAVEKPIHRDLFSNGISDVDFLGLKGIAFSVRRYVDSASVDAILFHCRIEGKKGSAETKVYELVRKGSAYALDLLADRDLRNPYGATTDPKEANIFKLGKWPVDIWARETFDDGVYEELLIDTIDRNVPGTDASPKVASKIYTGEIGGIAACFYMKDSRINGGATGDLEGLKYLAAVYISYLRGCPLYVWNDGAGANILQGMVSLVRGSEGFMMNTISGNMNREQFLAYAHNAPDPRLTELFRTIDAQIFAKGYGEERSYHFVAAVGIGSSAGLDVYGSSQAPVQLILDNEQSYRVLTGSNVIRSVMGENITNYEIGGARVMSKWAGIVDLVVSDKYHLVAQIRRLHTLFSAEERRGEISRSALMSPDAMEVNHFSENMVITNVDDGEYIPFKQDYYGSGSVVAGFAKLGGRRVALIGPRSTDGLRACAAVTRAHDVLRTSARMKIHPILVMGKRWHHDTDLYDESGVRARIDFVNTLREHNGVRICILTEVQGFQSLEVISLCDVIIFVSKKKPDAVETSFIEKNATFIVDSLDEAFNCACRVIDLVDPVSGETKNAGGVPVVPDDTASPYDMMESVIKKISDGGEFLEFFAAQNLTKTKSNFITGLASIGGQTVGILSDQPLILGGGADAPSTEKFRIFTQFVNRFGLRLLMLSNASGFIPGTKQERMRIQAIGGEALDVNISGTVPVVSVVLNQNYGGRQIQAFSKHLRPGIHYIARANATLAVLGHGVAFDLFKAKKYKELVDAGKQGEADLMRKEFIDGYLDKAKAKNDALATGAVDGIITDMKELRTMILDGFKKSEEACGKAFGK